jgi:hypothetical protein
MKKESGDHLFFPNCSFDLQSNLRAYASSFANCQLLIAILLLHSSRLQNDKGQ